jgi:hypothetical protein
MYREWNSGTWNATSRTWNEVLPEPLERKVRQMKVKTQTYQLTDPAVIQLTDNIIAGATGKTELANSPVTLAQLQTQRDNGATSLSDEAQAADALTLATTTREDNMALLRASVNRFAGHADSVYAGDKAQLQAIGLDVRALPAPVGMVTAPANLRSTPGVLEGTISLRWSAVRGRKMYHAECAPTGTGPWTPIYSGTTPATVCGALTPGAEYFFRVRAHGSAGMGPWSDVTKRRAS